MSTTLITIYGPSFVAGVVVDTKVWFNKCAPIVAYMRTWSVERIQQYCYSRGWQTITKKYRRRIR